MTKRSLLLVVVLVFSVCAFGQIIDDPLHGFCAGTGQCLDNGNNSPTSTNSPSNFGFTISPGPNTGDLFLEILVPDNEQNASSYAITGAATGSATLFSATDFTSGQLDAYLGMSASPNNPIGGFLDSSETALDSAATGFSVYQFDAGTQTLLDAPNPNISPLFSITGTIPIGSYIVGFLNVGGKTGIVATALSGAILETSSGTTGGSTGATAGGSTGATAGGSTGATAGGSTGGSVPEPGTMMLFGSALIGTLSLTRRKFMRS